MTPTDGYRKLSSTKSYIRCAPAEPKRTKFTDWKEYYDHGYVWKFVTQAILQMEGSATPLLVYPEASPSYPRPTPAEFFSLLQELPDLRLVNRVVIQDERHWLEPWQLLNGGSSIACEVMPGGEITLHRPELEGAKRSLVYGWSLLLRDRFPEERTLFDEAGALEPLLAAPVFAKDSAQAWAYLGEYLLATPSDEAVQWAHLNPVRASIFSQAVRKCLSSVVQGEGVGKHMEFVARMDTIWKQVAPKGLAIVESCASSAGDATTSKLDRFFRSRNADL
jgi:hypothetical protein